MANFRKAQQSSRGEKEFVQSRRELSNDKKAAVERLPQLIDQFTR
jgi:hypothetical protein